MGTLPFGEPGRWSAWLDANGPVVGAFALLRAAALVALCYLAGITILGLLLRMAGAVRLVACTDRLTVGPVRRLLAGISLGVTAVTAVAVAGPATMVQAAVAQAAPAPPVTSGLTMHRLGPGETTAPQAVPLPAPTPVPGAAIAPPADEGRGRWTVRPGDCFWTIAESVLTSSWNRAPTDAEIVPYWQRLIAANRSALASPGDPNLIYPGQVFEIPAP